MYFGSIGMFAVNSSGMTWISLRTKRDSQSWRLARRGTGMFDPPPREGFILPDKVPPPAAPPTIKALCHTVDT